MTYVFIGPIKTELDGAKVTIIEVSKYISLDNKPRYIVSVQVEYQGYQSPIFTLDVEDNDDLIQQLRTEIAKMKLAIYTGFTSPFKKIR